MSSLRLTNLATSCPTVGESARLCLSSDDRVRFADGPTLVAIPFKALIGDFCPELFQVR
jgi:hypothetical protein